MSFGHLGRREIEANFEGGALSSDGGLTVLQQVDTANNIALVFFAGHGVNDSISQYYFLPSNSDIMRLRCRAISNVDIVETLQWLPSRALAFLDPCHSGNVLGTGKKRALGDIDRLVNELTSAESGVVVFASRPARKLRRKARNGTTASSPRLWWKASPAGPTSTATASSRSTR